MGIFDKRIAFKPFEYPEVIAYKEAINHSFWLVSEWNFISDKHDFFTNMSPEEREVIRRTLLAISQIEVSVKRFWTQLGTRLPKAEFEQVGVTFGESEVRHADAYSHLLQVLDLNADFDKLMEVPAIQGRVEYLSEFMKHNTEPAGYALTLALFSSFVENVSLFSQFAIIKSFNKHRNILKDIDNVVQATQKEEAIHALLGQYLVSLIRKEHPGWFDETFVRMLHGTAKRAMYAEFEIIDWIFGQGDVSFISVDSLKAFVRHRLNESLEALGVSPLAPADSLLLQPLRWFTEELHAEVHSDFFHKRPVTYSKKMKSYTAQDLF